MDTKAAITWTRTAVLTALGGGIAAVVATAADPQKYRFPQDLGSGRMWPYFLTGMGLTFGGMLIRSPLGQKAMGAYQKSQAQMASDKAELEALKAQFKPPTPKE